MKPATNLLALSQMFEQIQVTGQKKVERASTVQQKPRKLEPLAPRDKIIVQEHNGPAGLHLAVNYTPGSWLEPSGRQLDNTGEDEDIFTSTVEYNL